MVKNLMKPGFLKYCFSICLFFPPFLGNAAGLLARRGLMMGGRGENTYSDTDTDSDTEEYVSNAHK